MDTRFDALEDNTILMDADNGDEVLDAVVKDLHSREDDQPLASTVAGQIESRDREEPFVLAHEPGDTDSVASLVCSALERTGHQAESSKLLDQINTVDASGPDEADDESAEADPAA